MTGGLLQGIGPVGLFATLLICGHMLADFVFQTGGLARRKRARVRWVWVHVAIVAVTQAVVLLPLISALALLVVLGIAVLHGFTDLLKIALERRHRRPLTYFALDQTLHLVALALGWWAWREGAAQGIPGSRPWWEIAPGSMPALASIAVVASAYAFNGTGGASIVGGLLRRYHLGEDPETTGAAEGEPKGRMIGILERMLVLTLVLIGQWGALGLVMAAKSIARFEDLKHRSFSEYYLIGTLASLLVATASGLLVLAVL